MSSATNPMIVTSADGSVMVVSFVTFGVFTSTDAGATWVRGMVEGMPLVSNEAPPQIAMNADGSVLCCVITDENAGDSHLYISKDFGKTWECPDGPRSPPAENVFSLVAIDASANYIYAWDPTVGETGMLLYMSLDNGTTFTGIPSVFSETFQPTNITCNSDGTRVYLGFDDNSLTRVERSKDNGGRDVFNSFPSSGLQMSVPDGLTGISSIACDGTDTLVLGDASGNVCISSNSGGSWQTPENLGTERVFVAMTTNKIIACTYDGEENHFSLQIGTYSSSTTSWTWQSQLMSEDNEWISVAMSANGQRAMAMTIAGALFQGSVNSDGGWTWTENQYFTLRFAALDGVCVSASGDHIAVCGMPGGIYTSSNAGASWTPTLSGEQMWSSIASSSDGQRLIACVAGSGNVWLSANFGANWTELVNTALPLNRNWLSVASNASGNTLVAACATVDDASGGLFVSYNSGESWGSNGEFGNNELLNVSISRDGLRGILINGTIIHTGVLGEGFGWSQVPTGLPVNVPWSSTAIDATGEHMAICSTNGQLWTSSDGGVIWTDASGAYSGAPYNWTSIDMDDTGRYMVACVEEGDIFTSDNSGENWRARDVNGGIRAWKTVASSADGSVIAAIEGPSGTSTQGLIYISRDYGATWASADYTTPTSGALPDAQIILDTVASSADGFATIEILSGLMLTSTDYTTPTSGALPDAQIIANIRGKEGAASRLTSFRVGTALVRNRPQRFTGFDDYGLFTQANALANTGNLF